MRCCLGWMERTTFSPLTRPFFQTEEHIDKITVARDNAANSVRGRGTAALARLDQMHFEGSLSDEEAEARPELYEALRNADESDIQRLLHDDDGVRDVMEIEGDGERPWLGASCVMSTRFLGAEARTSRMGTSSGRTLSSA
jgi:hypothetical protein